MAKRQTSEDIFALYAANKSMEFIRVFPDFLNELWGGGMAPGYVYSFWGPQGCGKSTVALQVVKSFCDQGLTVLHIDAEKALNDNQKECFKLTEHEASGSLIHTVADNYEDAEKLIDAAAEAGVSLIVIDSETSIQPIVPKGLAVTDVRPGLKALQSSFVMNKLKQLCYRHNIVALIIFQARANIQISGYGGGPETKQAGGWAALHIPDIITKITAHGKIKEGEIIIGNEIQAVCEKNKFAPPFIPIRKKLIFGTGISKRIDTVDTAVEMGIITMKGAGFYTLPDGTSVRGAKALYELPSDTLRDIAKRIEESR